MQNDPIKSSALFCELDEASLERALGFFKAQRRSYGRGEALHRMGEPLGRFGLVLTGAVNVLTYDYGGAPMMMANVGAGDTFGESLCFLGAPAHVHIEAALPCTVLWLSAEGVKAAPLDTPLERKLANRFTAMLAARALGMNDRIQVLSKHLLREKLNTYFLQCARSMGTEFTLPLSRERMAAYLGVDRSALSRELSRMQKEGLITFNKNHFKLLDK